MYNVYVYIAYIPDRRRYNAAVAAAASALWVNYAPFLPLLGRLAAVAAAFMRGKCCVYLVYLYMYLDCIE